MNITKLFPGPMIDSPSRMVSDKNENPEEISETMLDKVSKNFGFIIIGMMLVGAVVWTLIICV
jgi:hypothetical protein